VKIESDDGVRRWRGRMECEDGVWGCSIRME
jgi:hypothetical protein